MDVRLARPTDAPLALTLALDEGAHLIRNFGWPPTNPVALTATRAILPPPALRGRTWLARNRGSVALLEAEPRRWVIGWEVTRLVLRGDPGDVVGGVVQAAIDHVRSRGVPRLFARCEVDRSEEIRAAGFSALAREYVMVGPSGSVSPTEGLPFDSRYRMPQDAWPLHQLENEVTPPLVRQLEGLTSLDWSHKIRGMSEIVVERDGRIVCWIGWGVKLPRGYTQIGMLVHPRYHDCAADLLAYALQNSPADARFVARVRDYQCDAVRTFSDAGFETVAEEILLVKHGRVAEVREQKSRLKAAPAPSIHAFNNRLGHHHRPASIRRHSATGKG